VCFAGPMGDEFRAMQGPGSELIAVIEGSSHFDVMTKYYKLMGWGEYTTEFQDDHESFPEEWRSIQEADQSGAERRP